ncbi:4'-phosphopantetheinyl transferase superfamily protein [Streptomyces sp. NBC_01551]|uniref:4'-phosphopantetheinyl transferase family protein n=1 Tax=Streptomyces sp. NBC_01551 TaxID=2975876 RepID=UPI00225C31F6|nr:4'-phosphopantetheinyl transferase superfamily protein [Streptomyces sp. NBC_01551]MCX4525932.1 4'-phosphopantetheinyl transferase superfamily protein [Streptomyces sp. NBC_01551]
MTEYVNQLSGDTPLIGAPPVGTDITVWSLDTTLAAVGGLRVEEALPILDAAERERAGRLVRAGDRQRYLASHVGLRVLLGGYLGLAPEKVALTREDCPCCGAPHGRPAVVGGGVHFSLSHSGDLAYFAFAAAAVGVDVEAVPTPAAVADVVGSLNPAESAELTALPEEQRRVALARVWSRKEAYLKATGAGLALGLTEPYVGAGPAPAVVPGWVLLDLAAPVGYAAAVALRG